MGTARLEIGFSALKSVLGLPDDVEIDFVSIRTLTIGGRVHSFFSVLGSHESSALELQINHPSIKETETGKAIPTVWMEMESVRAARFVGFTYADEKEKTNE